MPLNINGTTGISGVDGSASAASIAGTDSNTGLSFASDTVNINTAGTTRATINSGGQLVLTSNIKWASANPFVYTFNGGSDGSVRSGIQFDGTNQKLAFYTGTNQRGEIDSAGKFILGSPTVGTSVASSLVISGRIQSDASYSLTTSSSANVHIGSNGLLRRSTSSTRYKKDIADATWGLADVLKLKPKTFKSNATGEDADDKIYGGFTAEDVHDTGLINFVEYNDNDQPDAVHYGNMVALLTKAIQELNTKVTTLETKVAALEAA